MSTPSPRPGRLPSEREVGDEFPIGEEVRRCHVERLQRGHPRGPTDEDRGRGEASAIAMISAQLA